MNDNRSVATIDAPEFINLQEDAINPGISQCEIKVFYLGKNRNHSFIDKNTAIQMANSLPGTPIVGAYRKDIDDFGDHGEVVHIENGEIQFSCSTIPYGFVAPDARCWFQKFTDTDDFGNEIQREYLMTTGYLWTGQYPEIAECIKEGKGQSMELDPHNLDGHWATDNNEGIEFFIINDAIFTKLCVLGDNVEPCFEGAAIQAPNISKNFTNNEKFANTLYQMMKELSFALQNNEGGSGMPEEIEETVEIEEVIDDTTVTEDEGDTDVSTDSDSAGAEDDSGTEFTHEGGENYSAKEKEDEEVEEEEDKVKTKNAKDDKDKKPSGKCSAEYQALQEQFNALQAEMAELRQFKLEAEKSVKEQLLNKYFMLSQEDKVPLAQNLDEYTYEGLEKELALMYVKQNVNFDSIDGSFEEEVEEEPALAFSLDDNVAGSVPPVVEALRQTVTK